MSLGLSIYLNIEHTCAQVLVCIGLNKKVRLFLHGGYPIMAYYNPIILDNIPIKNVQCRQGTTCTHQSWTIFGEGLKFFQIAKDLIVPGFSTKLLYLQFTTYSFTSSKQTLCPMVRKYIRHHGAYSIVRILYKQPQSSQAKKFKTAFE